jgi:hypothetical protein
MITVTLPANTWKALCRIAAKDDTRYYLLGVALDFSTPGRCHAVSTDGRRMLVVNAECDRETLEAAKGRTFIVPRELLERVKSFARNVPGVLVKIEPTADDVNTGTATVYGDATTSSALVDGRFPEWQRLVPDTVSGERGDYNFEYVGEFYKIADLLNCRFPTLIGNGPDRSAIISFGKSGGNVFAVLMPMRADADTYEYPQWLKRCELPTVDAAAV